MDIYIFLHMQIEFLIFKLQLWQTSNAMVFCIEKHQVQFSFLGLALPLPLPNPSHSYFVLRIHSLTFNKVFVLVIRMRIGWLFQNFMCIFNISKHILNFTKSKGNIFCKVFISGTAELFHPIWVKTNFNPMPRI